MESNKFIGLYNILVWFFKDGVDVFVIFLVIFMNRLINEGFIFVSWKYVIVILVFKFGLKFDIFNYCLILVLLVFVKILEKVVYEMVYNFLLKYKFLFFY